MKTTLFVKSIFGALLLTVLYMLFNMLLGQTIGFDNFFWGILPNYMVALLLGYYIMSSSLGGIRLSISVFLIYFLIGHFNLLIEAYIFNVSSRQETALEIIRGLFISVTFAPLYVYIFRNKIVKEAVIFSKRSLIGWFWRILVADILYLLLYIIAGFVLTIVYPQLLQFYEGKIPSFDILINTQLFIRGFIFIGIALLMLQTLNISVVKKAILIGLTFAILGGIAPLIPPSELMPAYVRLGHGFEVGISNFIYGILLTLLLKLNSGAKADINPGIAVKPTV
ncbi:hypothetical protein [uncultured Eudoraea sp.]|jgi:hypothetical protein|uniref:hypothetical protein n=1 Tax=uncultured Eudoraea sp. TaxID=1035614 RepID=UPI0026350DD7|nr:hypothetical protein [uncultured Eudoraea sp.]